MQLDVLPLPEGPLLVRLQCAGVKAFDVTVPDLAAAADACQAFIEDEGLGSDEWLGGEVFMDDETQKCVAIVSYNGRVWEPGGTNPEGQHIPSLKEFILY